MTRSVKTTIGKSVSHTPLYEYLENTPPELLEDIIEQWVTKDGKARVGGGAQPILDIDLTDPPSLFEAFTASRRLRLDIGHTLSADMGREEQVPGFMYDHSCYIEIQDDGRFYLLIERSDWIDRDLAKLEIILWAMHYLDQLEASTNKPAMLSASNGDLDTYIVGACDFHNVPVDGDAFGQIFSGKDEWPLEEASAAVHNFIAQCKKG